MEVEVMPHYSNFMRVNGYLPYAESGESLIHFNDYVTCTVE